MNFTNIKFDFNIPRISFGIGKIKDLGQELLNILKPIEIKIPNVFIVSGKESLRKSGHLNAIKINLEKLNINFEIYDKVNKEPTTSIVNNGRDIFINEKCNIIVGIGGGSALDSAKAIAGLVTNGGTIEDYHAGKEFVKVPVPFILCPTTSGTGSEVSNNSVIMDEKKGIKQSVRGLLTNLALLDPELTLFLPKNYTAYPGADALVQAIESLVSKGSNFISDLFARESIKLLGENLPKVYDDLNNIELREKMMLGSLLDGISFANGKLGAVHGFAHPIGVKYGISHGLICGLLLPYVMEYNSELDDVVEKYAWIADLFHKQKILTDYGDCPKQLPSNKKGKAKWSIEKVKDIFSYVEIPLHLADVGISESDVDNIVKDTKGASLANNPRETNEENLRKILLNAL